MAGAGELKSSLLESLLAAFNFGNCFFHEVGRNHPVAAHRGQLEGFFGRQFLKLTEDPQRMFDGMLRQEALLTTFLRFFMNPGNDHGYSQVGFLEFLQDPGDNLGFGEYPMDDRSVLDVIEDLLRGFYVTISGNHVPVINRLMFYEDPEKLPHFFRRSCFIETLGGHGEDDIITAEALSIPPPVEGVGHEFLLPFFFYGSFW
jgi:hypothetical protein